MQANLGRGYVAAELSDDSRPPGCFARLYTIDSQGQHIYQTFLNNRTGFSARGSNEKVALLCRSACTSTARTTTTPTAAPSAAVDPGITDPAPQGAPTATPSSPGGDPPTPPPAPATAAAPRPPHDIAVSSFSELQLAASVFRMPRHISESTQNDYITVFDSQ